MVSVSDKPEATVKRGPESWAYVYVVLGFALTIESTLVAMVTPLRFPWNILGFAIIAVATWYLFLWSGWFQNKLIWWKNQYENKFR